MEPRCRLFLGIADLDIALRENKLMINADSTAEQEEHRAKWERVDRLSIIKRIFFEHLLGDFPEEGTTKEFLATLMQIYQVFDNVEDEKLKNEKSAIALLSVPTKPRSGKNNLKKKTHSMFLTKVRMLRNQVYVDTTL